MKFDPKTDLYQEPPLERPRGDSITSGKIAVSSCRRVVGSTTPTALGSFITMCRGLASTLALLFTPVNSERAGAEHVGVAAASRSTPSSVLASAPGRLRPEAAAVQSERPHAAFQRQLLVVCALRQQRSSQSDSPRCLPEPRHSARVSQSQASQSPHQRASATRAVAPSFLSFCLFLCTLTSAITAADRTESTDSGDQQ